MYKHANSFLLIIALAILLPAISADQYPADVVNSHWYTGQYSAFQSGQTFGYLDGRSGRLLCIFYGEPNRDNINSLSIFLLDPRYEDEKMVLVEIDSLIDIKNESQWVNPDHNISYTTIWKERVQDTFDLYQVSTTITFFGLETQDQEEVTIKIEMVGPNFSFKADLAYDNEVVPTLGYSLFVTAVVAIQIYAGYILVGIMDAPNFVFTGKMSLLTLSLCNIQDFSQTMNHIQYIMGSQSGYLFFIFPSLAYIVLFIIFDMKMLFLVWRSHNLRNIDQPQILRKKLTSFYIQFYLGLFIYLTLTYFFSNDEWMIIVRNLILLPQIVHNVRLGSNPGFNFYYIFGFIGSRLLIPIYERLCPENRFRLSPNIELVVILLSIFVLEVILLYLQSRLGSRFFVPKRFQPNYFNYRQKIQLSEENKDFECSICLQNIFEPAHTNINASALEGSLEEPLQSEATVMKTPCRHNFHEECLRQWLQVKLQCPTCRAQLPPI